MSSSAGLVEKRRAWSVSVLYYGVLTVLLAGILTNTLADAMPAHLAKRIGYNSEGYLFALLLAVWIQFGLPRLRGRNRATVAIILGVMCAATGIGLLSSSLPAPIKTLNETWVALTLIIPYVALRRPLGIWAPLSSIVVLSAVIAAVPLEPDSLVVDLAETFGFLILVPLAFDVVDRGILDPWAVTEPRARHAWYALLVAIPVTVVILGVGERTGGGLHAVLEYLGRIHESFIGTLLVVLFFAVGLGRVGQDRVEDLAETVGPKTTPGLTTVMLDPEESTPSALREGPATRAADLHDA